MRLVFICNEVPYPPNHGGRADVWRRLLAFHSAGVKIHLICWYGDQPSELPLPEHLSKIREVVEELSLFVITRSIWGRVKRILRLPIYSFAVSSRIIDGLEWEATRSAIRKFSPDAVWLDAIYGGVVASRLSKEFGIPMFTRSHNVEHLYMKRQAQLELSLRRKLPLLLALAHLELFEVKMLSTSLAFYDISVDDLSYWKSRGLTNGYWLPPVIIPTPEVSHGGQEKYDIVFLGNLFAPNNVEGVIWFIKQVFPQILQRFPAATLVIAGSNAVHEIESICTQHPNITLIKNPKESSEVYAAARVLINPVLSGSGMNIKSVEMLFYDKPIITTSRGVGGMPEHVKSSFCIAENEVNFADEVCNALSGQKVNKARVNPSEIFGQAAVDALLIQMNKLMKGNM